MGCLSNGGCERNKIWHEGSLGDEHDARTLNTRVAQRKQAISYSTMDNNCNSIECCCNTHQGWHVRTNKRACASDLVDASHVTCYISQVVYAHNKFVCTNEFSVQVVLSRTVKWHPDAYCKSLGCAPAKC